MSEYEAGRELDALVASKVMGYTKVDPDGTWYALVPGRHTLTDITKAGSVPHYSTDIAAAWEVVRKMGEHPDAMKRTLTMRVYPYNRTYAAFLFDQWDSDFTPEGNGEHATPLAICLAALQSCGPAGAKA